MFDKKLTSDWITRIVTSAAASVVAAGIIGLFAMSGQISRLDERVKSLDERVSLWTRSNTERIDHASKQIDQITKDQRDSDRRLGAVEGRLRIN